METDTNTLTTTKRKLPSPNNSRSSSHLKTERTPVAIHVIMIAACIIFVAPLLIVISASFTDNTALTVNGYKFWPSKFSLMAYEWVFANPSSLINAYGVTILITVAGTFLGLAVMAPMAYVISRRFYVLRKFFTFLILFPMLFSGGLVSSYIINTRYLNLSNNLLVLILPNLVGSYYIIILRTFFSQLPGEIFESAKMDGASEFGLFFRICLPISTPVLATVAFLTALGKWNEWYNCLLYITDDRLNTLQYLLQRMMRNIEALYQMVQLAPGGISDIDLSKIPGENMRMAMLVVTIGPMLVFFPAFQKYFVKGMTVGSVKG